MLRHSFLISNCLAKINTTINQTGCKSQTRLCIFDFQWFDKADNLNTFQTAGLFMASSNSFAQILLKPFYRALNGMLSRARASQSRRIPVIELREEHIRNLRVVLNRDAFLEALPKSGVVAELGVDCGEFSKRILSISKPRRLHLIDMWSSVRYHGGLEKHVRDKFFDEVATGQVQIDLGRSTDALARFPDDYFDWVYIDTDHGFVMTAQELSLALNKVKPNGIIAGHDYVTGCWNGGKRYGVVEAVHEFCVKNRWELLLLTHETNRHLSFAIRRISG